MTGGPIARSGRPGSGVHLLFEHQAGSEATSDAIALVHGSREVSYGELDRRADQVAGHLQSSGVEPGDLVGVRLDRGPEMIAAMLGILKAGAAYVPIDPDDPVERSTHITAEAGLRALITGPGSGLPTAAAESPVPVLDLVALSAYRGGPPAPVLVDPAGPAYVIYTSGSTGRPKGVPMAHRSLLNLLHWHDRTRPGSCRLRTLQFCSVGFDFSFHEIFSTLCFGGTLVIADDRVRRDPFALARFVADNGVERLFLPVTALNQLADAVGERPLPLSLREVITTGEGLRITPALAHLFKRTGARLHNHYGATEFQDATCHTLSGDSATWPASVPIGRPIDNVSVHVLDADLRPVPPGQDGELYIGGAGVAGGYLNRPDLTRERFIPDPFGEGRLYRTGDLGRLRPDGVLEHLGRADAQVKIHGVRVEPGEIESLLGAHPDVKDSVVAAHGPSGHKRLAAHVVLRGGTSRDGIAQRLHRYLAGKLPSAMRPDAYVVLDELPLTASGKKDRRGLAAPATFARLTDAPLARPGTETERVLAEIWRDVLHLDAVGVHDNFFDAGGTSAHLVEVQKQITERTGVDLTAVDLFGHPTVRALAERLSASGGDRRRRRTARAATADPDPAIAIIGMSGRFPGADDIPTFWRNLREGVESVTPLSDRETEQHDPRLLHHPDYVRAAAPISDIESFDAEFFDIGPEEAAVIDPQQRVFLQCAWEAFESAGYDPGAASGPAGVFAGSNISTYLMNNVAPHLGGASDTPFTEADLRQFRMKLGNDRNYLPTRVSYKLNLNGPSVNLQTACSTSLVAVHQACQSLRSGECDMALAGGVSIVVPQRSGYLFEDGMIRSPDGHCRAFDARAAGTLFGNGCGVVLLKRLTEAVADGDEIVAVIKGSAVNNDGADKVGFTAPSVTRQADVVEDALRDAGVDAGTVTYIEAHGTGTRLGDPIEIAALNDAFQRTGAGPLPRGHCAVGSVKSNIGHLDEAAGIAGLIKTALALKHRCRPPSLHVEQPNPRIDFEGGPFFVNTSLTDWPAADGPRRAGVSSFGIGGTNCHVVLEEAPPAGGSDHGGAGPELLTLSARTDDALRRTALRYAAHLAERPDQSLADVCHTAAVGRRHFEHRLAVIAETAEQARAGLETSASALGTAAKPPRDPGATAFLFGGQGTQHVGMGRALYETRPVFRAALDRCDALLRPHLDRPLPAVLFPAEGEASPIDDTAYAQPALFAVEYALAELWRSWGVEPGAVVGHSVGEYVAACVAGVFSLDDALTLLAARARLMQALPGGRMVSVAADEVSVAPFIRPYADRAAIAAVNGALSTVVSGEGTAVAEVCAALAEQGRTWTDLTVSHAFHSPMMEPMLAEFTEVARSVRYSPPHTTIVSNVTGAVIGDEIAAADYWVRQVRQPVRFADAVDAVAGLGARVFVELSPKPVLLQLVRRRLPDTDAVLVPSLRPGRGREQMLRGVRDLYLAGAAIDWTAFHAPRGRRRVALPTYPWQRRRHWISAPSPGSSPAPRGSGAPLAGRPIELAESSEIRFESVIGPRRLSWLGDHRIFQTIVLPGVAYLEMALAAAKRALGGAPFELRDFMIHRAMPFADEDAERTVQLVLRPVAGGRSYDLRILARPQDGSGPGPAARASWVLHASGRLAPAGAGPAAPAAADLEPGSAAEVPVEEIYRGEREREIDLGPSFHATERLWHEGASCLSEIGLPASERPGSDAYEVHPVILEACFLALTVTYPERYGRRTYVPVGVERLLVEGPGASSARCRARLRPADGDDPETLRGDVRLFAADGRPILTMEGILLKRADRAAMLGGSAPEWTRWLYTTEWTASGREAATPQAPASWLVLSDADLGPAVAEAVRAKGGRCTLVPAPGLPPTGRASAADAAGDPSDSASPDRIAGMVRDHDVVVDCRPLAPVSDSTAPDGAASAHTTRLLDLVQELTRRDAAPAPLFIVTRGAQSVGDRPVGDVAQAALWGMGRVIALEHGELGVTMIDLDPGTSLADQVGALVPEIAAAARPGAGAGAAEQVGFRGRARHVPRLARARIDASITRPPVTGAGTYVVTGGFGGLGLEVARSLAAAGARHLALVGRRGADAAGEPALRAIRASGARVAAFKADVSDERQVIDLLAEIGADPELPSVRGIAHLAGVLDDGLLRSLTPERFARVMAPKAAGAWNLHLATLDLDLDFFAVFSSVAAALGTPGQANYAAANAFLDGLASHRRGRGLPALSVQWGSWSEVGMSARMNLDERLEREGEGVIPKEAGVDAFGSLLHASPPGGVMAVLPIDWDRFLKAQAAVPSFLSGMRSGGADSPMPDAAPGWDLGAVPADRRKAVLAERVRADLAQVLGERVDLEPDTGFSALGMDSLMAIELRNRLQKGVGTRLGFTVVFDYPTLTSLVDHLHELVDRAVAPAPDPRAGRPDDAPDRPGAAGDAARRLAAKLGVEIRD
ncbi:amino acid adenylation domain-containing protein [Murinocardiopsis flavida]|uniref:Amino acid adenylation domain-containing protein n=1 Tax=Murinocardiopsis flavida TaxID=645275 RepID=A0A2P8D566_9ACTN|nr:type I polyketide synthase [Murinocardiopsis flavida]PSK92342.1 amino acid adenylation domain-containing protein [Murinocardiopsis flavida]